MRRYKTEIAYLPLIALEICKPVFLPRHYQLCHAHNPRAGRRATRYVHGDWTWFEERIADELVDTLRILKPGGVFAFSVWHKDNQGWAPDLRSCFESLPFEAPMSNPVPMAIHGKPQWVDPEGVEKELRTHGFEDVQVRTVPHVVRIHSAEDFLQSYKMMIDWMVNSCWNEESKQRAKGMLHDHIVKHLKEKHDGQGWDLHWTVILATCQKPS